VSGGAHRSIVLSAAYCSFELLPIIGRGTQIIVRTLMIHLSGSDSGPSKEKHIERGGLQT